VRAVEAAGRVLVVALGHPERGDDGVGSAVAARLKGRLPPGVALRVCGGDLLGLIEAWADVALLVCVDAAASLGEPGRIHRLDLATDGLLRETSLASSHGFGLAETLELSRAIGRVPPRIVVYAVEGECFTLGSTLSEAVAAAVGRVVERVLDEVSGFLPSPAGGDIF